MLLLTGATGYVGGRLLRQLESQGLRVRCLARRPEHLLGRVAATTEVVQGDVLDPASLDPALRGVEAAYYLVHALGGDGDFERQESAAARSFGAACAQAGVKRIIYLGGLADPGAPLSPHLRSRLASGEALRTSGVPVIEFRASIVLGAGSLSFEMIRALVERLPVMITPRWVRVQAQPIGVEDVLAYLEAARTAPFAESRVFEIGGPDVVSYSELMREYARQRGLRRIMIPVPVLTPYLSSLWLGLVTPLFARIGRKLVESLRHPTIVRDPSALEAFAIRPIGMQQAIARALADEDAAFAQTRWSDALSSAGPPQAYGGERFGNRLIDRRELTVPVPPERAFAPIRRIGGRAGWYYANGLWRLRGALDLLAGGVGMRRGRRDPEHLAVGDVLDCWRVEAVEPDRRLRLRAEMRLPGRAWLEFAVQPLGSGARISQTATFDPLGLSGLAYWYGIWPLHALVFRGMIRGVARQAQRAAADEAA